MYALIQKTEGSVPFVISKNDQYFGDYVNNLGYQIIEEGTKRAIMDREKEILEEIYYESQFY